MSFSLKAFASRCAAVALTLGALAGTQPAAAYVLGSTTPGKWGSPVMGTGASLTWSLMPTGTACMELDNQNQPVNCSITHLADFMPSGFMQQIQAAFDAWAAVANLTFTMVTDDGAAFNAPTTGGDIRIGGHDFDGPGAVLAHGYYPPANGDTAAGDIHFDVDDTWALDFNGPGFSIYQVMVHELGHALGLEHTDVPNSLMNPFYATNFSGPQADDIAGMQFIYGAPQATPEPASALALAFGLAVLAARRRRG